MKYFFKDKTILLSLIKRTPEIAILRLYELFESIQLKHGDKGEIGEKGIKGEKGEVGSKGDVGAVGPIGPQGQKGSKGDKGESGRDGKNGKSGRDGRAGRDGVNGKDGRDGSPDTAEEVRDKLQMLRGENRLDASAIKNLPQSIKTHSQRSTRLGRGTGSPLLFYDLTPQCNGVLKTFTVPSHRPNSALLFSTQFPVIFRPTIDYSASGSALTLTNEVSAPEAGQTLLFLYAEN